MDTDANEIAIEAVARAIAREAGMDLTNEAQENPRAMMDSDNPKTQLMVRQARAAIRAIQALPTKAERR